MTPDPSRLGRPEGEPSADQAPHWVADGTPEPLRSELIQLLGQEPVLTRAADLIRYASDASPYRVIPRAVVVARDVDDIRRLIAYCRTAGVPVCFRAGGTSLSGQSGTGGVLIDVRRHWAGMVAEEDGKRLRVRPGVILDHANRVLARHGRRLGPDPASASVATVGGVIANNAGGMRCTPDRDAYHTVRSMTLVLASGTVIDTAGPDAERRFAEQEPELAQGLLRLRAEMLGDQELAERVRHKFRIRNTTGYRLDALLDGTTPLEIFRRLVIGSEGTLAFVAEAVLDTIAAPRRTTVAWIYADSLESAAQLVPGLVALGAEAVELVVASALIGAQQVWPGTPAFWAKLPPGSAALLVEFTGDSEADLDGAESRAAAAIDGRELLHPVEFTREPAEIKLAWDVREGMLGLVGMMRPPGAALVTEDVCFPPHLIAEATRDLQALLSKHGFLPGVAGHAALGNLHFLLTPAFGVPDDLRRYTEFIAELVELVVGSYGGSLKAEHGTGVNMAPFVEHEWGATATEMMWQIKRLADPDGVLAPDVVLSRDPEINLRNLKSTPRIEAVADRCIECGLCEAVCPSRDLTTTPRQRIVLRREMARQPEGARVLRVLQQQFEYDALQTCAADGACQASCPVWIDTGKLVTGLRAHQHTGREEAVALWFARHARLAEALLYGGLTVADAVSRAVGSGAVGAVTRAARKIIGPELVPAWQPVMPGPAGRRLPQPPRRAAVAVYFPSCANRILGRAPGTGAGPSLPEALVALSQRAGVPLWIPPDVAGTCCSMPWSSKGYQQGQAHVAGTVADALWRWTGQGALPVVVDAASCSYGLLNEVGAQLAGEQQDRFSRLRIQDCVEWIHDRVLPGIEVTSRLPSLALHPPCSTERMGLTGSLEKIAGAMADEVTVPVGASCCGTAGDRGLLHPELPAAALGRVTGELAGCERTAYVSANRTCEMGLQQVTGRPYQSFVLVLEELTR